MERSLVAGNDPQTWDLDAQISHADWVRGLARRLASDAATAGDVLWLLSDERRNGGRSSIRTAQGQPDVTIDEHLAPRTIELAPNPEALR